MVSCRSRTSVRSSLSKSTTGSAGVRSTGSPKSRMGWTGTAAPRERRRDEAQSTKVFPGPAERGQMARMTDIEIVDPRIEQYAVEHTTPEPPWFATLAEETRAGTRAPTMMVGTLEGRFLAALVAMQRPRLVLE